MTDQSTSRKVEPQLVPGKSGSTSAEPVQEKPSHLRPADVDPDGANNTKETGKAESAPGDADSTATAAEQEATSQPAPRPKRIRRLLTRVMLLGIVPLLAIIAGLWFYVHGGRIVSTENAYVKTNIVAISSDLDGRVTDVLVQDNQVVQRGDLLFRLDDAELRLKLAEVDAEISVIASDVDSIRANYREALNEVNEIRSEVRFLEREASRQKRLRDRGIGTEQAWDKARTEVEMARQKVNAAVEKASRVLATLGGQKAAKLKDHPRYLRAEAARALAVDRLQRIDVRAPADGVVSNMRLQAGEWVDSGTPVFSILETGTLWIEANLKETQLTNVAIGQDVSFTVDAYPAHEFRATVQHIAPATGSEFSLLPPQNATGNWVKVVQRIPVTLSIAPDSEAPVLRAGMTATIDIDTQTSRSLPGVMQEFARGIGLPRRVLDYFNITSP